MTDYIVVRPDHFDQLGSAEESVFCLVTNPRIMDRFVIEESPQYPRHLITSLAASEDLPHLLSEVIPQSAHVLVISPDCLIESPPLEKLGLRRKLLVMPCHSTPNSLGSIEHFLWAVERTNSATQAAFADHFFERGRASKHLTIVDEIYGVSAVFRHLDETYEWNQQAGPVDWGEQQIAPAGELSCLPTDVMQYDANCRLDVNGEIALKGPPIVHSGKAPFAREDQAAIYAELADLVERAVIATIESGVIRKVRPATGAATSGARMLEALFDVDVRYRVVWEIGFGINTELALRSGNFGMNEVYGATNGVFHLGLGLTPYTQYALTFLCPNSIVLDADGQLMIGERYGAVVSP